MGKPPVKKSSARTRVAVCVCLPLVLAAGAGLVLATNTWNGPRADVMPLAPLTPSGQQGTVAVGANVESHWAAWNGQYALFGHRTAPVHELDDLSSLYLLIPSFTYGEFDEKHAQQFRAKVLRFALDAGMRVEEEPRFGFFQARFLSEPGALALVPDQLAKALALDSATGVQRLTLRSTN